MGQRGTVNTTRTSPELSSSGLQAPRLTPDPCQVPFPVHGTLWESSGTHSRRQTFPPFCPSLLSPRDKGRQKTFGTLPSSSLSKTSTAFIETIAFFRLHSDVTVLGNVQLCDRRPWLRQLARMVHSWGVWLEEPRVPRVGLQLAGAGQ